MKTRLLLTTALASAFIGYHVPTAVAGTAPEACVANPDKPNYLCSGVSDSDNVIIKEDGANVIADDTFLLNGVFTITGQKHISFVDSEGTVIDGTSSKTGFALSISSTGDDKTDGTPGGVSAEINGRIINRVLLENHSSGDTYARINGHIDGIEISSQFNSNDLIFVTGDNSIVGKVSGKFPGMLYGKNTLTHKGYGVLSITHRGSMSDLSTNSQSGTYITTYAGSTIADLHVNNYGGNLVAHLDGKIDTYSGASFSQDGEDMSITTGENSEIVSTGKGSGLVLAHKGTGKFDVNIGGSINVSGDRQSALNSIDALQIRSETSGDTNIIITEGARIENASTTDDKKRADFAAIAIENRGRSGNLSLILESDTVIKGEAGIVANNRVNSTANITVNEGAQIIATGEADSYNTGERFGAGIAVAGDFDININGTIKSENYGVMHTGGLDSSRINIGSTGRVEAKNIALYTSTRFGNSSPVEINTSGTIIATDSNGKAIVFGYTPEDPSSYYSGPYAASGPHTLNIHGGRIVGDVIDMSPSKEFSNVFVAGDFTSEGDFDVSTFTVKKDATFTAGAKTAIASSRAATEILGTFRVTDKASVTGGLNNKGTLFLDGGELTVDTMTPDANGSIVIGVNSTTDYGSLIITDGAAEMKNQTVSVHLAQNDALRDGDTIRFVDGKLKAIGSDDKTVGSNSPIWEFTLKSGADIEGGDDSDLYIVASKAAPAPQVAVDGAIVATTLTFADSAMNLTGERLSALRSGGGSGTTPNTGVSAGEEAGSRFWMQALGQKINQDMRKGIAGYDASLYGATIGIDTDRYLNNGVIGIALSYGHSNIDSKDTFKSETNIDSYQLTFYGDYNWDNGTYFEGQLAYALNKNNKTRHNAGGAGLDAKANFDSHNFAMRGEVGRTYTTGAAFVTPFALASWLRYTADDYKETGAGLANLSVSSTTMNQIDLGLGVKAGMTFTLESGSKLVPELHAAYRRDMLGDKLSTTQSYIGGGGPTIVAESPDPARNKFTLGARVKYYSTGNFELTGAYDFDIKQDYTSHTGLIRAGWKF